jgi:hypothetical protein
MRKDVLIRGADEETYRKAKAIAAMRGVSVSEAFNEALREWVESYGRDLDRTGYDANSNYLRRHWKGLAKQRKKVVVVADGALQGRFDSYEEAWDAASKFTQAMVFGVDRKPRKVEIEIGADVQIQ